MKRRDFITRTTLATAGATGLLAASCTNAEKKAAATNEHPQSSIPEFPLQEATIASLQEKMAAGTYSSAAITQLYLDRIAAVDHSGPRLNAVIEINPDAVAIARSLDEERKNGKVRGPLHGIPVLIKDNIDTADKMQTTAGSLALANTIAPRDATIVAQLRAAGAVLLDGAQIGTVTSGNFSPVLEHGIALAFLPPPQPPASAHAPRAVGRRTRRAPPSTYPGAVAQR